MQGASTEYPIERRFGPLLDAAPDAMIIADTSGTILLANSHVERIFGYRKDQLAGLSVEQLMPESARRQHMQHIQHFHRHAAPRPMGSGQGMLYGLRADGTKFPVDISLNPLVADGKQMVVAAIRDMTLRQIVEDRLRELTEELERSRAGLQAVLDSLSEGVIVFSLEGEILDANPAALRMHGCATVDDVRRTIKGLACNFHVYTLDGSPLSVDQWPVSRVARGETLSNVELEVWREGLGQRCTLSYSGAPVLNRSGKPILGLCTISDITERKKTEERIRQAGLHDSLTGLPNRALLFEYSRHVFARTRRSQHNAAVLFIDLDRFKPINDMHGHEIGDAVLQEVSRRLRRSVRQEDITFRIGGDEFLIVLPDIEDGAYAGEVARHVARSVNQPYLVDGLELSLSSSIGISIYPRDAQEIDTLVNQADIAMYHAKRSGRNRYQFYSSDLAERANVQSRIENMLREAVMRGEFYLCYQPVVDMHTAEVTSVEALLRWPHEDIGPERFVPVAEATGLIGRLGEWVIREACRQHAAWIAKGLPPIPIAVNVSAVEFRQTNFVDMFSKAIAACHVSTQAIQLELTETALMDDIGRAMAHLSLIRTLGIKIVLDDFGTGYSSLSYLSRLPLDKIKVDRSFVYGIEHDATSRTIADAIISLGRSLQMEIVAEGIESPEAMQYLQSHGCSQAQGFHVCAPVDADAFEAWYRKRKQATLVL